MTPLPSGFGAILFRVQVAFMTTAPDPDPVPTQSRPLPINTEIDPSLPQSEYGYSIITDPLNYRAPNSQFRWTPSLNATYNIRLRIPHTSVTRYFRPAAAVVLMSYPGGNGYDTPTPTPVFYGNLNYGLKNTGLIIEPPNSYWVDVNMVLNRYVYGILTTPTVDHDQALVDGIYYAKTMYLNSRASVSIYDAGAGGSQGGSGAGGAVRLWFGDMALPDCEILTVTQYKGCKIWVISGVTHDIRHIEMISAVSYSLIIDEVETGAIDVNSIVGAQPEVFKIANLRDNETWEMLEYDRCYIENPLQIDVIGGNIYAYQFRIVQDGVI